MLTDRSTPACSSKRRRAARDNQLSKQTDGVNDRRASWYLSPPAGNVITLNFWIMSALPRCWRCLFCYNGLHTRANLRQAYNMPPQQGAGRCITATTATRTSAPACASSARCARTSTCAWNASGAYTSYKMPLMGSQQPVRNTDSIHCLANGAATSNICVGAFSALFAVPQPSANAYLRLVLQPALP